jgi:hypothetical protein
MQQGGGLRGDEYRLRDWFCGAAGKMRGFLALLGMTPLFCFGYL